MKKILIDCDNTIGLKDCDMDDALAIMYLLGNPQATVLGITTTYGNNEEDKVYDCTRKLLADLSLSHIPVVSGEGTLGSRGSLAPKFLVEQVNNHKNDIYLLAIGSLTNLQAAYELDNAFFDKLSGIVLMGGITEPLLVNGIPMKELNFSCDPKAAETVLTKGHNVSILSGNHCAEYIIHNEEYKERLCKGSQMGEYIYNATKYWFSFKRREYQVDGFVPWDALAANYLMMPELYSENKVPCCVSEKNLKDGLIDIKGKANTIVNLPVIGYWESIKDEMIDKWLNVGGKDNECRQEINGDIGQGICGEFAV